MALAVGSEGRTQRLEFAPGRWSRTRMAVGPYPDAAVAVSGAWSSADTLTLKTCLYETPFVVTQRFRFEGDRIHYVREANVGFGPTRAAELVGRAE